MTTSEYEDALDKYGEDTFTVGIGAEAIKTLLASINLQKEKEISLNALKSTSSLSRMAEHKPIVSICT
jgi:DNA-directed RNA polymerase subunit beta'